MKHLLLALALVASTLGASAKTDIKSILSGLAKSDTTSNATSTSVSGILGVLGTLTGNDAVSFNQLEGTWKYSAPAVSFKSDNLLKKAGGMAASEKIKAQIKPFYEKAGLQEMTITFASDSTFTMQVKKVNLSGTIAVDASGQYVFTFKAAGKISLGKMNAYINRVDGSKVALTFDASKLITLVEKISQISGNASLKSASALLSSYDGLTLGFELQKQ